MIITDKQKKAILFLMDLYVNKHINEDKYFLFMEFVIGNNDPQNTYIPFTQTDPQPLDPVYGKFGKVTCGQYEVKDVLTNMEDSNDK